MLIADAPHSNHICRSRAPGKQGLGRHSADERAAGLQLLDGFRGALRLCGGSSELIIRQRMCCALQHTVEQVECIANRWRHLISQLQLQLQPVTNNHWHYEGLHVASKPTWYRVIWRPSRSAGVGKPSHPAFLMSASIVWLTLHPSASATCGAPRCNQPTGTVITQTQPTQCEGCQM